MLRRLLTLLSALSLLVCLSLLFLWPWSYRQAYRIRFARGLIDANIAGLIYAQNLKLSACQGAVYFSASRLDDPGPSPTIDWSCDAFKPTWLILDLVSERDAHFAGFRFYGFARPDRWAIYVAVPLWLPALLTAVLPSWLLFIRLRHRRRLRLNLCPTCAYHLRATPTQCPECGSPITAPLTANKDVVQSAS